MTSNTIRLGKSEECSQGRWGEVETNAVQRIQSFLDSLKGHIFSQKLIAIHRSSLLNFTIEDLSKIINNSTPIQWGTRPDFFQAVIDEIESRGQ